MAELLGIGEVVERTGVSHSALRFYEAEGLVSAERSPGGQRRYARPTLRRIAFIRVAQRVGLSLDEIRDALATLPAGRTPTPADWRHLSSAWRERLDAQIGLLVRLRDELDSCIGCGCLSLAACKLYNPDDRVHVLGPGARFLLGDPRSDPATPIVPEPTGGPTLPTSPAPPSARRSPTPPTSPAPPRPPTSPAPGRPPRGNASRRESAGSPVTPA